MWLDAERRPVAFPSDYRGWTDYTAFEHEGGLSAFLGNFSVPDKPEQAPDVLYTVVEMRVE